MRDCHVGVWGWSIQCPPFKLVALPGQKRRVINDAFSPFVSFGVYAPRGVAEKIGGVYGEPSFLGGFPGGMSFR